MRFFSFGGYGLALAALALVFWRLWQLPDTKARIVLRYLLRSSDFYSVLFWWISLGFQVPEVSKNLRRSILLKLLVGRWLKRKRDENATQVAEPLSWSTQQDLPKNTLNASIILSSPRVRIFLVLTALFCNSTFSLRIGDGDLGAAKCTYTLVRECGLVGAGTGFRAD